MEPFTRMNVWTYEFLQRAIQQARKDGENLDGQYLESPDLFVKRLDHKLLEAVFADLIRRDRFSGNGRSCPTPAMRKQSMTLDRRKTLTELEGQDWGPPNFDSHLIATIHQLRYKPLDQLCACGKRV